MLIKKLSVLIKFSVSFIEGLQASFQEIQVNKYSSDISVRFCLHSNLLYWIYSIMCHIMYQNDLRNISQQNIYLLKVNNRSTRKRREKCWTSTIKTPEWCHCLRPGIFILLTLNVFHALLLSAFVIFNQENVCWDCFGIFY